MNFPIQACATCGEQTENLFCPNCRKKLLLEQVKVFWNAQSWAQYRATVLDFQSFSSSLPYLETRVLSAPDEEQPAARKMGLLVGIVAAALVAAVVLALWFTRVNSESPEEADLVEAGPDGKPRPAGPKIPEGPLRTPRPSPKAGVRPLPGGTAPGRLGRATEDVCGVGSSKPKPVDQTAEEVCASRQPRSNAPPLRPEDVCGHHSPKPLDPGTQEEAEDLCQNQLRAKPP